MTGAGLDFFGVPLEFVFFALTLLGVALFHRRSLAVSVTGLLSIVILKLGFSGFDLRAHLIHEAPVLGNLLGLLLGFAVLAKHFEDSRLPLLMPRWLPDDWKGPFVLLILVFILSTFLDNIAAALIGGAVAHAVFGGKVHVGYLAALTAAANAGGAGSVLGDTTTTMMWIDGVAAREVLPAFVGAGTALLVFGPIASLQQDRHWRIVRDAPEKVSLDGTKLVAVAAALIGAVIANVAFGLPAVGVWAGLLLAAPFARPSWKTGGAALPGAAFLLALVLAASMMPVEHLPSASWPSTLGLGFVSSVFDNIPLTKLALLQGGYDWGMLAYAVGFGGSLLWFGSSAGVALSAMYPEMRSVGSWVKRGWHLAPAYLLGFFVMLWALGWDPK